MTRSLKVCGQPGCPNLQPCPTHTPAGWSANQRRQRLGGKSGWAQQRTRDRILRRDHYVCHVCHRPGADQLDHVVPTFEGGSDRDDNLAAIHRTPCHRDKTIAERIRAQTGGVPPR